MLSYRSRVDEDVAGVALTCEDCGEPFEAGEVDCMNPQCETGAFNIAMDRGDRLYHDTVDRELER